MKMSIIELTATTPVRGYLVEATYEAFTVNTTAFIKFFAAWIKDVAESSWMIKRELI